VKQADYSGVSEMAGGSRQARRVAEAAAKNARSERQRDTDRYLPNELEQRGQ